MQISFNLISPLLAKTSVLLLLMAGISCSKNIENVEVIGMDDSQILVCDYDNVDDKREVRFSELMDSLQIIRFENKDEAFFKFRWMNFSDNYIIVRQERAAALLFDKSGRFIAPIGSFGQGPGEYSSSPSDCVIDENAGVIYLLPFVGSSILKYDLKGNYLGDIKLPTPINKGKLSLQSDSILSLFHICFKDDNRGNKFNGANINLSHNDSIRYIYSDQLATSLQSVPGKTDGFDNEIWSYRSAPGFPVTMTYTDTLYHYNSDDNRIKACFTFKIDRKKHSDFSFYILNELPDHYIIYMVGEASDILVDKRRHQAYEVEFVNDYLGNAKTSLQFQDGYYWATYEPADFIDILEKTVSSGDCNAEQKQQLESLVETIDENDNNILLLGRLKGRF